MTVFQSFVRALGQFDDPAFRRVILLGTALAALVMGAMLGLLLWGLSAVPQTGIGWLDTALQVFGGLVSVVLAGLFFPAMAGLVISFLVDDIADAVEKRHYPMLPPATDLGYLRPLLMAARFMAVILAANIAGLVIVYAIPGLNLLVFLLINGYLLGREFFDMVALRRLPPDEVAGLRRRHGPLVLIAGIGIAALFAVPLVNIVAPIIGVAAMVHIFQKLPGHD